MTVVTRHNKPADPKTWEGTHKFIRSPSVAIIFLTYLYRIRSVHEPLGLLFIRFFHRYLNISTFHYCGFVNLTYFGCHTQQGLRLPSALDRNRNGNFSWPTWTTDTVEQSMPMKNLSWTFLTSDRGRTMC